MGDQLGQRHERALAMRYHRLGSGQATFDDLPEVARHLTALVRFDELAEFALTITDQIQGELGVATFLSDLITTFPRSHPRALPLIDREREALQTSATAKPPPNAPTNCSMSPAAAPRPTRATSSCNAT